MFRESGEFAGLQCGRLLEVLLVLVFALNPYVRAVYVRRFSLWRIFGRPSRRGRVTLRR